MDGISSIKINGLKPTLIIVVNQKNEHLPADGTPILQITKESLQFKYRSIHGELILGAWSKYFSKVVFEKQNALAQIQSMNDRAVRIAYNNVKPRFFVKNDKCDDDTLEGILIGTYIEKRKLKPKFMNMLGVWGNENPKTGIWNGLFGKVIYDEADFGVGYLGYSRERAAVTTFTTALGEATLNWVSKYPEKTSPAYNIVKVFDVALWWAVGLGTIATGIILAGMSFLGNYMGNPQHDYVIIMLMPLMLINAEGMPEWFLSKNKRVYSVSILLLSWGIGAAFLTNAFSCNLRAILLQPSYDNPLETAQQIYEENRVVLLMSSAQYYETLKSSRDPWQRKMENFRYFNPLEEPLNEIMMGIMKGNGEVLIITKDVSLFLIQLIPAFSKRSTPAFYIAKEPIGSYYGSMVVQKQSKWEKDLNMHILICKQAGLEQKVWNSLSKTLYFEGISDTEKLNLEHLVIPFAMLAVGFFLGFIGNILFTLL
ncbi:glutamate receptor 3 [Eurytemora carolleeae]|uniref:glutamate receptor 3 n=1 Tax=Eurytemora carolleeae TaxID=1294199 RepID=UPI000C78D895|nr:glutamate receptor 3 [Eurytemora carolleeae]|eukprot:XP_023345796.1 glutamate receptor 3-like [Eurytemora affinis]